MSMTDEELVKDWALLSVNTKTLINMMVSELSGYDFTLMERLIWAGCDVPLVFDHAVALRRKIDQEEKTAIDKNIKLHLSAQRKERCNAVRYAKSLRDRAKASLDKELKDLSQACLEELRCFLAVTEANFKSYYLDEDETEDTQGKE